MSYKLGCNSDHSRMDIKFIRLLEKGKNKVKRFRITFRCGCRVMQSRWLWEQSNGPIPDGYVIHHKNGDTTDDRIENFEMMTETQHLELHGGPIRKRAALGHKHSEETKRKMGLAKKGNKYWLGKHHTEEYKAHMREINSGEKNSQYGKHLSDEQKEHLRQVNLGRTSPNKGKRLSDEHKRKLSESLLNSSKNKGRHWTDEHKQKISESVRSSLKNRGGP